MKNHIFDGLKAMLSASGKAEKEMVKGAETVLRGIEQRRAEYEIKRKAVQDDIKRGSRRSNGRIPF